MFALELETTQLHNPTAALQRAAKQTRFRILETSFATAPRQRLWYVKPCSTNRFLRCNDEMGALACVCIL
jgi:hypothetical protein